MRQKIVYLNGVRSFFLAGDETGSTDPNALPRSLSAGWAIKGVFPIGADATQGEKKLETLA